MFTWKHTSWAMAGAMALVTSASAQRSADLEYVLWDLGTLGGDEAMPLAINDDGVVVGWSDTGGEVSERHAFLWEDGGMFDLGTLGGTWSEARALNMQGEVVGVSETATGDVHAFYYRRGMMQDLNDLTPVVGDGGAGPGDPECTAPIRIITDANGISEHGVIVGCGYLWSDEALHGFAFLPNRMGSYDYRDLGRLPASDDCVPHAIGVDGRVVGASGNHPFVWTDGRLEPIETMLRGRAAEGAALAINERGVVAGYTVAWAGPHASVWVNGVRRDLTGGPGVTSVANGINSVGDAVGWAMPWDAVPVAMIWSADGRGTDLNDVTAIPIPETHAFPWASLTEATGINRWNRIIGVGRALDGRQRAFVLTPFRPDRPWMSE